MHYGHIGQSLFIFPSNRVYKTHELLTYRCKMVSKDRCTAVIDLPGHRGVEEASALARLVIVPFLYIMGCLQMTMQPL